MMIVGLTGGIGSGKTTVANFFIELGVPVYNSDEEAKKLMISSKKIKKALINLLGEKAYDGKSLNKKYISEQIFNNEDKLLKVNKIVHPVVEEHFLAWAKKQKTTYVIQETALIFENLKQDFYDFIILVSAPKNIRIQRVMLRDKSSEKEVSNRLKNQLDDAEKIALSDYVLYNTDLNETKLKVRELHEEILNNN